MWSFCKLILLFLLVTVCHWALATLFSFCGLSVNMMLVFAVAFCAVLKPVFGYSVAFFYASLLENKRPEHVDFPRFFRPVLGGVI